jgi:translocation and assembly module TamB
MKHVSRAAHLLALLAVFVAALAAGLALHVGLVPGRRWAASAVTALLSRTLNGTIVIEHIDGLSMDGVSGVSAKVYDETGARVLAVDGLRARIPLHSLWRIVFPEKGAEAGSRKIALTISRVRIEHAEVVVQADDNGDITIARAFTPRPRESAPSSGGTTEVSVWLPDIELGTAAVTGRVAGLSDFAADLANVSGSVLAGSERTSIRVRRYSVRARGPLPAELSGAAQTQIELPSSTGQKVSVWGTLDGFLGDLQVGLRAGLDGKTLDLALDVPTARRETVQSLAPSLPLHDDGRLRIEARGQLPNLDVSGGATIGGSDVAVRGTVSTAPEPGARVDVDVRALDLRSFLPSAPATSLTGHAHVDARLSSEIHQVVGTADLVLEPFGIGELEVPATTATVKLDTSGLEGRATSDGKALHSRLDFRMLRSDAPSAIDLDWTARTPDIAALPWVRLAGTGQANWHAQGRIADGRLDARASADVGHWSRSGFALERGHLLGTVRGPFTALSISSRLQGQHLQLAGRDWPDVEASVDGPVDKLAIAASARSEGEPEIGGQLVLERGARISGAELSARREGVTLVARAGTVEIGESGVALKDLQLEGAGSPVHGSMLIGPAEWRVQMASSEVDLAKLAKIARPAFDVRGLLTFDVDGTFGARANRAHARLELRDGSFAGIDGISGNGEASLDGSTFSGGVNAEIGPLGSITLTSQRATLAGPPWQSSAWTSATGGVEVRAQANLSKIAGLPAVRLTRLGSVGGMAWTRAILSREDFEAHRGHAPTATTAPPPNIDLLVWTDGLRADLGRPVGPLGSVLEGVDGQVGLHVEGETGQLTATARAVDENGILAVLTALAKVPASHLWEHPSDARATLETVPITANLSLPRRKLASYPAILNMESLAGEAEGMLEWTGSLRAPAILTRMNGYGVQPGSGLSMPVDVQGDLTYDGTEAKLEIQASRDKALVFDGKAKVKVPIGVVLGEQSPTWDASGDARLVSFPLIGIPELAERDMSGLASGTLSFSNLASDPDANVTLALSNVKIDRASFPHGLVSGKLSHGGLVVSGRLDQAEGGMSASATARVLWPKTLTPALDRRVPFDLYVEARELHAAVLRPLLFRGIFAYFDARLDGSLHLHQERQGDMDTGSADGSVELRDARFQIPEIGQQFQNGRATLSVDKRGEVKVTDVSADAAAGRFTANGSFELSGLRFTHGEGTVVVNKNEAIPITLEGLSVGEAWGTLKAQASMDTGNTVKLDVEVPTFHTELPESSSRDLQSLSDNPKVSTGVRGEDGKLLPLALGAPEAQRAEDALRWHFEFTLGNDVYLRRGSMMELTLGGKPVVDLTDRAHVSGAVDFRSGKIEVFGKQFQLEHGTARFEGDEPGNPDVSVSARWDAPDGTRVYADFVGPLRTGVLTIRSEPQRAQNEIMSLLLVGSGDSDSGPMAPGSSVMPGTAQQQGNEAQTAGVVLAGGAVTTNLNRVLSSVSPLDITTRVASDAAQGWIPEVAVQITPRVTAQVSYRTRAPSPGEKPDRVFVMLDWRFRRNWSVVTTFGDQQSSMLDLIWQYRY